MNSCKLFCGPQVTFPGSGGPSVWEPLLYIMGLVLTRLDSPLPLLCYLRKSSAWFQCGHHGALWSPRTYKKMDRDMWT